MLICYFLSTLLSFTLCSPLSATSSFKKVSENTYEITADITLLGKTRPITITALQTGIGKDPYGKFRRGFESTFTLKRSDFGMDFMLGGVSDEVQMTISVEGIRQ